MHADGWRPCCAQSADRRHRLQPAQAGASRTAQFVATEMGFESPILTSPALSPDADYAAFQQLISQHSKLEGVLVIGHNPNLHQFIAKLISGNGNGNGHPNGGSGGTIRLRKGAIARIDMSRHPSQLQWLIDPRLARVIYTSVTKSSRPKTSQKVSCFFAQRPKLELSSCPARMQSSSKTRLG